MLDVLDYRGAGMYDWSLQHLEDNTEQLQREKNGTLFVLALQFGCHKVQL